MTVETEVPDGRGDEVLRAAIENEEELNAIFERIAAADSLEDIIWALEQDMLVLLGAERITLYRRDPQGKEIVSWFRSSDDDLAEIRLPLSPTSIAGYVAMSHQPLKIDDVYDTAYLESIHHSLKFDHSYDQESGFMTESMIVVPVKFKETLLGVIQVINRQAGGPFSDDDVIKALAVGQVVAERFRHEMKSTAGPYEHLIKTNMVTFEQLEELEEFAAAESKSLVKLLQKECGINVAEIGESLSLYFQVPFMAYDETVTPDAETIGRLNLAYLARNLWVPFRGENDEAIVLLHDPNDAEGIMELQYLLNAPSYEFRVGVKEDILRYLGIEIDEEEEGDINLDDLVAELEAEAETQAMAAEELEGLEEDELDENASPVVQLVNRLIVEAVDIGCSDIHVEPCKGKNPAVVRMRVDGVCRPMLQIPSTHIRAVTSRIKVLSRLDIAERRKPQDGKMVVKVNGQPIELRVATLPTVNGESVIMRILAAGDPLPFEKLNLAPNNQEQIEEMLTHPHGLMLVVGPTGSGKTTTLHGLLGYLNQPDRKILTAEDPVEITQDGLQQVQVQPKIGYTFAMALRAFLRCDPDIILIGEMRDEETAHSGIEASLTGHLVLSTLHTNSAPETVIRLLDMGLDPMNFADALIGVLAQRLMRTLCSNCKEEYTPDQHELERLIHVFGEDYLPELELDLNSITLCRAKGCGRCSNTGYRGRTGIHELLNATGEMKTLISKNSTVTEIRDLAIAQGMRTIRQDGVRKIFQGISDLTQLLRITGE